jgi:hypothetical protein
MRDILVMQVQEIGIPLGRFKNRQIFISQVTVPDLAAV